MIENLVIDDLRHFIDDRTVVYARNSNDGIKKLMNNIHEGIENLWLDHDLGKVYPQDSLEHHHSVPSSSFGTVEVEPMIMHDPHTKVIDSIKPIVNYLANYYKNNGGLYPVKNILIHTSNRVGRDDMYQRLTSAGYNAQIVQNVDGVLHSVERLFED